MSDDVVAQLAHLSTLKISTLDIARRRGLGEGFRPPCLKRRKNGRLCSNKVDVTTYVLTRPVEGICRKEDGGCGQAWTAPAVGPLCTTCGWSKDHREGMGCLSGGN